MNYQLNVILTHIYTYIHICFFIIETEHILIYNTHTYAHADIYIYIYACICMSVCVYMCVCYVLVCVLFQ